VIVLAHNIPRDHALRLCRWRLRANHIGFEVGRPDWQANQTLDLRPGLHAAVETAR